VEIRRLVADPDLLGHRVAASVDRRGAARVRQLFLLLVHRLLGPTSFLVDAVVGRRSAYRRCMTLLQRLGAAVAMSATVLVLGASPANAAPTESATLDCGTAQFEVTGFGRGQVLQVTNSTSRFIVTRAELESGQTVFIAPGRTGADNTVRCTVTSPSGTFFVFEGFLHPSVVSGAGVGRCPPEARVHRQALAPRPCTRRPGRPHRLPRGAAVASPMAPGRAREKSARQRLTPAAHDGPR
jgi:hypothetical protein